MPLAFVCTHVTLISRYTYTCSPSIEALSAVCAPGAGLDARAAVIVMHAVKNVSRNGRTVMVTIHQPSIEIFEAFDALVLLQAGGRVRPQGFRASKLVGDPPPLLLAPVAVPVCAFPQTHCMKPCHLQPCETDSHVCSACCASGGRDTAESLERGAARHGAQCFAK